MALYCSVLWCAAVCCSVRQCDPVCCSMLHHGALRCTVLHCVICAALCCTLLHYGVATISRLLKIIGLFCKRDLWKRRNSGTHCNTLQHSSKVLHFATGWRRLIGCLKLQVIFRKRATNYRALLWKVAYKDKASYDSTPPCTLCCNSRLLTITGLFCKRAL